jgi:N-terminal domain of reverse transcriptase
MTGYSFTTPVWDGGSWVTPAVAEVRAARVANGPEDQPRDAPAQWDKIDWRAQEGQVRRLRQRIFAASQAGDLSKVRNLQKLTAPRGALSYPRFSREEFEGRFLGLMPYLELKGEGNHSMVRCEALYRIPCVTGRNLVGCSWV